MLAKPDYSSPTRSASEGNVLQSLACASGWCYTNPGYSTVRASAAFRTAAGWAQARREGAAGRPGNSTGCNTAHPTGSPSAGDNRRNPPRASAAGGSHRVPRAGSCRRGMPAMPPPARPTARDPPRPSAVARRWRSDPTGHRNREHSRAKCAWCDPRWREYGTATESLANHRHPPHASRAKPPIWQRLPRST
jgi:hypothetical protein